MKNSGTKTGTGGWFFKSKVPTGDNETYKKARKYGSFKGTN